MRKSTLPNKTGYLLKEDSALLLLGPALLIRLSFCTLLLLATMTRTTAQWVALNTGTNEYLRDVHFLDSDYGAVVGDGGTVLLTENGGLDWEVIGMGIEEDLTAVLIWNQDTLLVSGRTTGPLKTYLSTNGGMNWTTVNDALELARIDNRLLSSGYDTFDWSDDQGQTWTASGATIGNTTIISQIDIADAETAFASGNVSGFSQYSFYGYRTIDQGEHWAPIYVFDLPNSDSWTASAYPQADTLLVFTNEPINFLPGPNNKLIRLTNYYFDTSNGLNNWRFDSETINENLPTYVHDAAFVNSNMGYIVGENGQIYRTVDGGQQWTSIYLGTQALHAIALVDMEIAYVVGAQGLVLKNENLTSLMNPGAMDQLEIWPNPTADQIYIRGIDLPSTKVFLYDMSGRLLKSWTWHQGEPVNLRNLPRGQYQLSVQLKRQRLTYPILKQ